MYKNEFSYGINVQLSILFWSKRVPILRFKAII